MKKNFITLLLLLVPLTLLAQSRGSIRGTLLDSETDEAIAGATIEISPIADTTKKSYQMTGANGVINLQNMQYGNYQLKFRFIGYETKEITVELNSLRKEVGRVPIVQEAPTLKRSMPLGERFAHRKGEIRSDIMLPPLRSPMMPTQSH